MRKLFESEWQGETNPGGYQGPEIEPSTGIVLDNSDPVTHSLETAEEKRKRDKEKEALAKEAETPIEAGHLDLVKENAEHALSLEELLDDPEFVHHLMSELNKYQVSSQIETVVKNLSFLILEDHNEI